MILTQPIVPTVRDASLPVLLVALVVYLTPSVVAFTISRERSRAGKISRASGHGR